MTADMWAPLRTVHTWIFPDISRLSVNVPILTHSAAYDISSGKMENRYVGFGLGVSRKRCRLEIDLQVTCCRTFTRITQERLYCYATQSRRMMDDVTGWPVKHLPTPHLLLPTMSMDGSEEYVRHNGRVAIFAANSNSQLKQRCRHVGRRGNDALAVPLERERGAVK